MLAPFSNQHEALGPAYVRYQRPPVVDRFEPLLLDSGERLEGEVKYYDYGVASVIYQLPFSGDWESLVQLASRWVWDIDFTSHVEPIVRQKLDACPAPWSSLTPGGSAKTTSIFHVREAAGEPTAADSTRDHGLQIAQVVRGDRHSCRQASGRGAAFANLLLCTRCGRSWLNAAFLYDSTAGAETSIQLLEYANSQLLEFRHYDELLTAILDGVYDSLEQNGECGRVGVWPAPQPACTPSCSTLPSSPKHAD